MYLFVLFSQRQQSELEVIPSVVVDESSGQNDDWTQDSSESEEEPTVVENLKASKAWNCDTLRKTYK